MKKKYVLFIVMIITLGMAVNGCYVARRGYYRPYHHHHAPYYHYYNRHY